MEYKETEYFKSYHTKHEMECRYIIQNLNIKKLNNYDFPYDIYVSEGGYHEPCFYFGENVGANTKKLDDFTFVVKIPNDINNLEVIGSSTDYKSFNGFKKEENLLKEWLQIKDNDISNLDRIRNNWESLNKTNS